MSWEDPMIINPEKDPKKILERIRASMDKIRQNLEEGKTGIPLYNPMVIPQHVYERYINGTPEEKAEIEFRFYYNG